VAKRGAEEKEKWDNLAVRERETEAERETRHSESPSQSR